MIANRHEISIQPGNFHFVRHSGIHHAEYVRTMRQCGIRADGAPPPAFTQNGGCENRRCGHQMQGGCQIALVRDASHQGTQCFQRRQFHQCVIKSIRVMKYLQAGFAERLLKLFSCRELFEKSVPQKFNSIFDAAVGTRSSSDRPRMTSLPASPSTSDSTVSAATTSSSPLFMVFLLVCLSTLVPSIIDVNLDEIDQCWEQ